MFAVITMYRARQLLGGSKNLASFDGHFVRAPKFRCGRSQFARVWFLGGTKKERLWPHPICGGKWVLYHGLVLGILY